MRNDRRAYQVGAAATGSVVGVTNAAILLKYFLATRSVGPLVRGFDDRLAVGIVIIILRPNRVRETAQNENNNRGQPQPFGFRHASPCVPSRYRHSL
jgi:hypothetical protein